MQGEQAELSACREAVGRKGATESAKTVNLTYSPLSQTAGVETEYIHSEIHRFPTAM